MKLTVVDPQNDPNLIPWIMTRVTATARIPYNFYSILDYGYQLHNLHPHKDLMKLLCDGQFGDGNTLEFDKGYAAQLLGDDKSFIDFMILMQGVICVEDETILLSNYTSRVVMPILDSLLKLIQQRYGINTFIVNTVDDIDPLGVSELGSLEQQQTFSSDLARYIKLTGSGHIIMASQKELQEDLESLQESQQQATPMTIGV